MRLFIAIELPKNVKREVSRILTTLDKEKSGGRTVPLQNSHITLSFLGETNNLVGATSAMRSAVSGIRPFPLHLGEFTSFCSSDENKHTAYISILGKTDELESLHESLSSALRDEGFSTERKKYVPHITLGRSIVMCDNAIQTLKNITPPLNASMTVYGISLYESTRTDRGMVYSCLHTEKFE